MRAIGARTICPELLTAAEKLQYDGGRRTLTPKQIPIA